ncbi:MAG: hypothetical protein EOO13_06315 [Chitinophagaceae bacterium]|nr:MAG: hypothetical protein EOO13_06315 [Chitinophagaceae bacterium]
MTLLFRTSISLILLCAHFTVFSQPSNQGYQFLKDDSLIRNKYYDLSQEKKKELMSVVDKSQTKAYKEIYDEIFTDIGSMWKSTRVIVDAKANDYLQAVAQKIIAVNPVLKGLDLKIVFTRDWWPNAACMTDGTIVFNAGLLMYMSNEAELAFVLSHEMAHYYRQHSAKSIKKYIETVSSEDFQAEVKKLSKQEYGANKELEALTKGTVLNSRRHSRDSESEADRFAFQFLKNTGYDCKAIVTCLQLLDRIDDTLKSSTAKYQEVFNFSDYVFKKKWIQAESAIFSQLDEKADIGLSKKEQDSLKTHPDCLSRIASLKDSISNCLPGQAFIVSQETFSGLKNNFFAEITEECYRGESLSRNLYYGLLLMQDESKKALGIYTVARGLNRIYEVQKVHKLGSKLDLEDKKYSEDYNLLLRLLGRIRLEELANVNHQFCKKYEAYMQNYPGFDKELLKANIAKNNYQ